VRYPIEAVGARFTPSNHWGEQASPECRRIEETLRDLSVIADDIAFGDLRALKDHLVGARDPDSFDYKVVADIHAVIYRFF
jgi:hypothetical protein